MVLPGMPKLVRSDIFAEIKALDESGTNKCLDVPIDGYGVNRCADSSLHIFDAYGISLVLKDTEQSDARGSDPKPVLADECGKICVGRLVFHDLMILSLT